MTPAQIEFYKRLAHSLALQFGPNCEIVVHDLETEDMDHSIVAIENGHVSGRKLGDGPSHIVLESMHEDATEVHDHAPYLTKTADGKLLKSSTIFIRDDDGNPVGIMGINFDITLMKAFERSLEALTGTGDKGYTEPEPITKNIGDLLEDLLRECEQYVGKLRPHDQGRAHSRYRIPRPPRRLPYLQIERARLRVLWHLQVQLLQLPQRGQGRG